MELSRGNHSGSIPPFPEPNPSSEPLTSVMVVSMFFSTFHSVATSTSPPLVAFPVCLAARVEVIGCSVMRAWD